MKRTISILSFLMAALVALAGGAVLSVASGLPLAGIAAVLFGASFIPMPKGALMAIQREIWINDIVGNVFTTNPHLNYAYSADEFVLAGKVVHIPNSGTAPTVTRNRSSLPAAVVTRTDADITFSLDEFTTAPTLITNADEAELSYDKRRSVIGDHSDVLAELVGTWFLYYWAPTAVGQMVRTTGASTPAHIGTGVRKALTLADILAAETLMNNNKMPMKDRYAILDANMYAQLQADMSASQYRDFTQNQNVAEGVLGKMYTFTFLDPRSYVLRYSNAGTPVPIDPDGTNAAVTDYAAGLFWHKSAVIRALGDKVFFEDVNNPTYYGSIYSALLRAGGRKRRNDAKGVIALVQDVYTQG
jgi:hypothetical protein